MAVSSSPTEAGCGEGSLSSKPGNCEALPSSTETRCINSGTSRASGRRSDSLASWIKSLAPQSDSTYAISGFCWRVLSSTVTRPRCAAPNIASTNSMRLPSSSPTRSPPRRPIFRNPAATHADCCTTSRHVIRLSPQTSASPSGFLAAASDTIAQMLLGRSQNAGTTRSPKRVSSRMAGIEYCDQSIWKPLALGLHAIDMFRTWESAGAHVGGIALDRGFDHGCEIAVAADKFRRPRRQAQHIVQQQYLTVAGRTEVGAHAGKCD